MSTRKVSIYLDEELRDWLWRMRVLTNRPLGGLFKEALTDFREKTIAQEVGCLDPETGRVFVKVAGQDFPEREGPIVLKGGRPPEP